MRPLAPVLMAACLGACGGGDMSENSAISPPTAMAAAKTSFTAFTEKLIGSQSETAEPLAVALADFSFADDDNEAAFAAVVPAV
ncbi:MAG TPA: hypothetical protein VKB72_09995 [Steroidobacteraceae bacterium]|nr:hypothetical protein [Steroidobacteraceae bacterium]